MKGFIPPLVLSRFLQRQPLAIHYLRECVTEEARKHTPAVHVRFSLISNGVPSEHTRTKEQCDMDGSGEGESLNPLDFANNALASFIYVNNASCKQYEDPVGISEFIGYNTAPRTKRKQRRRHRCCPGSGLEQGGVVDRSSNNNKESFFSSGSCEECGMHVSSRRTLSVGGAGGGAGAGGGGGGGSTPGSGSSSRRLCNYITK